MKIKLKKCIFMMCFITLFTTAIAGCSSKEKATNTDNEVKSEVETQVNDVEPTNAESEVENDTRIISTVKGDIKVPANPQRVVVNWYIGDVFTLGIKPVAAYAWSHETMPFFDNFEGVVSIENWDSEEIMSYDPDLIITYSEDDFDNYSKIAPVIVVPEENVTSIERLRFLGEVTGRETEAETAIALFEEKLVTAKEQLDADIFKDKTFSILQDWGASSYGMYYETGSRGGTLLYEFLGLHKPEKLTQLVAESKQGRGSLSYEVAADYFGDYVLWFLMEDTESEFAKTDIWNSIPAVKNGNIIEIPGNMTGLFFYSDVTSLTAQLDYIVGRLVEVSDK